MAKEKQILVIGEGAKVERQMVSRLFESYPDENVEKWDIVPFRANLYHLYDVVETEYCCESCGMPERDCLLAE